LLACALVISVGTNALPLEFWWKIFLACVAYLIGGWISGVIRRADIDLALQQVRNSLNYVRS